MNSSNFTNYLTLFDIDHMPDVIFHDLSYKCPQKDCLKCNIIYPCIISDKLLCNEPIENLRLRIKSKIPLTMSKVTTMILKSAVMNELKNKQLYSDSN